MALGQLVMQQFSQYDNPLIGRYASQAMSQLWSPQRKFGLWRRLWVMLAEAEHELGLPISKQQITELRSKVDDIDFAVAEQYEKRLRHDVMAHVHAYGDACPSAKGVIHLGATSCYVTDNGDLLLMREGLAMVRARLAQVIVSLADFANAQKDLPCLAYTHLQPAQPTTVGKRACLWNYDFVLDLAEVDSRIAGMKARSVKGTTGTQASFLELFGGDHDKVRSLERRVAEKMGFAEVLAVSGQTYSRKVDSQILDCLSGIAQSAHKMCTDLRLLAGQKEIEEPFEKEQIGSSAMAYKRNPMRSERVCSLARFVMGLPSMLAQTVATQWMERTLDDSAIRRLTIPQAFLAVDAILVLLQNITSGLVVYPKVIAKRLEEEIPFMATENILMAAVAVGGDRQALHERIRQHSVAAAKQVKEEGRPNDLLARLKSDQAFAKVNLDHALAPSQFTGRAAKQVEEFETEVIRPIRKSVGDGQSPSEELRV
jgi:adenylosuccinate lyase